MLWNHSKHFHDDVHGEIETVRKKWGALAGLGQGGEEKPAVVVVMENGLTPVATRHHVVKSAGKFKAEAAWHWVRVGAKTRLSRFAH